MIIYGVVVTQQVAAIIQKDLRTGSEQPLYQLSPWLSCAFRTDLAFFFFFLFSFLVFLFACHKFFHDEYLPTSSTFCHSSNITFHLIYYTYMQDSEVVRINYWFYFVQNYAYSAKCRTEHLRQHLMVSSLLVHNSGCAQRTQWTKHKWWQRCLSS